MPRLKFERRPIDRSLEHYQTREDHEAWVRERWARHPGEGEPGPCSCGFYTDDWLVSCDDVQRVRCLTNVDKRLEFEARQAHERGLRAKREFPGPPHDGKGTGWCRWCGSEIINPKTGRRHASRTWCADGKCFHLYNLHTFHHAQRKHLNERDGEGCKLCGSQEYGEVDHFIALAVAWEVFRDDARWSWFFSPAQLRLLCKSCHTAKTREDVALLKEVRRQGPEWGKSTILAMLKDEGLLRLAR